MTEADLAWRTRGSKLWDRQLMDYEMEALMRSFEGTARVSCQHGMSIISLICNVARTSEILEQARPAAAALALRYPPELCLSRLLAVPAVQGLNFICVDMGIQSPPSHAIRAVIDPGTASFC